MKESQEQQNNKLVKASASGLRISPRKMRLVTNLVKNMPATAAVTQLQFTNKKGAPMLAKVIKAAIANAENNFSLKAENLYIKSVTCDMGQTMSRYFPRARGSAFVIRRKTSHVNVVLEDKGKQEGKKSRFSGILSRSKKDKDTVKTVEGSIGVPEVTEQKLDTQDNASDNSTSHNENSEQAITAKEGVRPTNK